MFLISDWLDFRVIPSPYCLTFPFHNCALATLILSQHILYVVERVGLTCGCKRLFKFLTLCQTDTRQHLIIKLDWTN